MAPRVGVLAAAVVAATALSISPIGSASAASPSSPVVTSTQTLVAPNPAATGFGDGFSLDEARAVAAATVGTTKVVYVFDRQPSGTWSHTATIPAPAGSGARWGNHLAVSGNTIAVTDPDERHPGENYGRVDVFDRVGGSWTRVQTVVVGGSFLFFAAGVWLTGDAMVVRVGGYCDASCNYGQWILYERNSANQFAPIFPSTFSRPGSLLRVGVDAGRFAVANPSFDDPFCNRVVDAGLMVWNSDTNPASVVIDETVPYPSQFCGATPPDEFRLVDISAGVLVTETCCASEKQLDVRRQTSSGYTPEATLAITSPSDALVAVPGVILRADRVAKVLHSHVLAGGQWVAGADVSLPADAVVPPAGPINDGVVAAGTFVAFRGNNSVHVLTVVPATGPRCLGHPVTVDLNAGGAPGPGDDVILGTPRNDWIAAGAGNDLVCGGGGVDLIDSGAGADVVVGESGNDFIAGGTGTDFLVGGPGNDVVNGGLGADLVTGSEDADLVLGGSGDDRVLGGPGTDGLLGGPGRDDCNGEGGVDLARDCERLTSAFPI